MRQYSIRMDSVRSFVDEYCKISHLIDVSKGFPALYVDRSVLYKEYATFCENEKRHPFSAPQFYGKVADIIAETLEMDLKVDDIYRQRRTADKVIRMAHYINLKEAVEFNERNPNPMKEVK